MKRLLILVVLCFTGWTFTFAADNPALLPESFAGWTQTGHPQISASPAQADPAYPAVLQEYGFADSETATYTRDDGRKLTIKAARFNDATGAYGAFTFYRQPAMRTEQIGTKAASANDRILFFRSNVLVDANFDRITEMSAAELRELAGHVAGRFGHSRKSSHASAIFAQERCSGELGEVHSGTAGAAGSESAAHGRRG